MAKMVIIIDDAHDAASVARDVASIPGVSVTSLAEGFVDVDAASKGSLVQLKRFTESSTGLSLHRVADAELMEPIPTSKIF
jgi:hypothetical protein